MSPADDPPRPWPEADAPATCSSAKTSPGAPATTPSGDNDGQPARSGARKPVITTPGCKGNPAGIGCPRVSSPSGQGRASTTKCRRPEARRRRWWRTCRGRARHGAPSSPPPAACTRPRSGGPPRVPPLQRPAPPRGDPARPRSMDPHHRSPCNAQGAAQVLAKVRMSASTYSAIGRSNTPRVFGHHLARRPPRPAAASPAAVWISAVTSREARPPASSRRKSTRTALGGVEGARQHRGVIGHGDARELPTRSRYRAARLQATRTATVSAIVDDRPSNSSSSASAACRGRQASRRRQRQARCRLRVRR